MKEDESLNYGVFRRRHHPRRVEVVARYLDSPRDLSGPFMVRGHERVPDVNEAVFLCDDRIGSVSYGWVQAVHGRVITIRFTMPGILAMAEALDNKGGEACSESGSE